MSRIVESIDFEEVFPALEEEVVHRFGYGVQEIEARSKFVDIIHDGVDVDKSDLQYHKENEQPSYLY